MGSLSIILCLSTPNFFILQLHYYPIQQSSVSLQDKDNKDNKEFKVDWKRVGVTSSFGFAFVGPVGHYWLVPCILSHVVTSTCLCVYFL
jgi:hypothetical protein